MDALAATAGLVEQSGKSNAVLRVYPELRDKLVGVPRYLFNDKAIQTAVEVTLGRPKVVREALRHLVIPYPWLWVEWNDAARTKLRDTVEVENRQLKALRPLPSRVGFLLHTEPGGRRGTATWVWNTQDSAFQGRLGDGLPPAVGQIQPYFDLDRVFPLPDERLVALQGSNLWNLWMDSPVQSEALIDIWRTAEHSPSAWGAAYFRLTGHRPVEQALAYADVCGELIQMYACLLLLTASRPVLDLTPVARGKLNKARAKRGERPLLEYSDATLKLTPQAQQPVSRGPLDYTRKSPRIHYVSSYPVVHHGKFSIVQPYIRGQGEWVTRRVQVQG